jgi:hypothetical protein
MDVQMREIRVPGVTRKPDFLTGLNCIPGRDDDAALLQVGQCYIALLGQPDDDVIAGE